MKKLSVLAILISCLFVACQNNSNSTIITEGTWRVAHYTDSGKDETSDFAGYTFTFKSNGQFVATVGSTTTTGTWSETSSNTPRLIIAIAGTKQLDEISDDWILVEKTTTSIKIKDDNAASMEEFHLVKN